MKIYRGMNILPILMALPAVGLAAAAPLATAAASSAPSASQQSNDSSPLVDKVRRATERFMDINAAVAAGFVQATPCVSGPDFGAMGVHFVLKSRLSNVTLNAEEPEALIYEPLSNGSMRLVGVEFIVLASVWSKLHTDGSTPALDGQLLNYIEAPNRFGLPAFYEIHVWAWENNPVGSFADWNSHVTCTQQPIAN